MLTVLVCIVRRDLAIVMRRRADVLTAVIFFAVVVSLFPLATTPDTERLRDIGPGVVWVAALLSSVLTLPRLFSADYTDGTLDQMLLSASPFGAIVSGKIIAHWLTAGLPLVALSPVLALQFGLTPVATLALTCSLFLGTPVLSLIGAIGAALTLGARGAGILVSLLVLPLYVPVLVLGTGLVNAADAGLDTSAHFMLLVAMIITSGVLAPWAVSSALRGAA